MTKKAVKTPPKTVADVFSEHSDLTAVKVIVVGLVKGEKGQEEIELAQLIGTRRQFAKSGNFGFYAGGKAPDLTEKGQETGTKFQVGVNITAIKSGQTWV